MSVKKVLQIGPLNFPQNPSRYGGAERVCGYLDRGLTELGIESHVLASGDSKISGKLVPVIDEHLWKHGTKVGEGYREVYEKEFKMAVDLILGDGYDVVHDHTRMLILSDTYDKYRDDIADVGVGILSTLHGPRKGGAVMLDQQGRARLSMSQGKNEFYNTVSYSQLKFFPELRVDFVIHNGVDPTEYTFSKKKGDSRYGKYLLSLSRFGHKKGQADAIEIFKSGYEGRYKLIMAGPIHDQEYFDTRVAPHLNGDIRYVGEVTNEEKNHRLLPYATAYMMPINWADPCPVSVIEALACGTPLAARDMGSMKELIDHGKTGLLFKTNEEAAAVLAEIDSIDPEDCRKSIFRKKLTLKDNTKSYLDAYTKIKKTAK